MRIWWIFSTCRARELSELSYSVWILLFDSVRHKTDPSPLHFQHAPASLIRVRSQVRLPQKSASVTKKAQRRHHTLSRAARNTGQALCGTHLERNRRLWKRTRRYTDSLTSIFEARQLFRWNSSAPCLVKGRRRCRREGLNRHDCFCEVPRRVCLLKRTPSECDFAVQKLEGKEVTAYQGLNVLQAPRHFSALTSKTSLSRSGSTCRSTRTAASSRKLTE